jgi:hypothetical protein
MNDGTIMMLAYYGMVCVIVLSVAAYVITDRICDEVREARRDKRAENEEDKPCPPAT